MIGHRHVAQLVANFRRRDEEVQRAQEYVGKFASAFYKAIETVIAVLREEGITTIQMPEIEELPDGGEQLSFVERDYRFVFVPYRGVAFPALGGCGLPEELTDELGKKQAGRLIAFYYPLDDPSATKALCDFYVFADGSWCVCGAGHSEHQAFDEQGIADYAIHLLDTLQEGFQRHWRDRDDISLTMDDLGKPEPRFRIPHVE